MTIEKDRKPAFEKKSFYCPHCDVYAHQTWNVLKQKLFRDEYDKWEGLFKEARCSSCGDFSIWLNKKMLYPTESFAPKPDNNMPPKVKEIYEEASLVSIHSSRAAAALLRVALEKLTEHLDETKGSLFTRIGNLHKRDFPEEVIKMLDIARLKANKGGAHAGEIDMTGADGVEVANTLFWLVNHIVEIAINIPNKIKHEYAKIPQSKLEEIDKRDKPKDKK